MALEFSLAHLTLLDRSPRELVEIAHKTGYDFVSFRLTSVVDGERIFPLISDITERREVKNRLSDTGLGVLDIELVLLGSRNEPESYLDFLETGEDLGASHVICQMPDSDRARAIDRFARLCELAKPFGLTVDLEFPSWTELATLGDAVNVLEQANQSNAGILVDTLHFARSDSTVEQLRTLPREWFNFVHLCDAKKEIPVTKKELIYTARSDRYFPGKGGINIQEIVSAMPQVPYSLEIPNDQLRKVLGDEEYARQAIDNARQYLSKIGA